MQALGEVDCNFAKSFVFSGIAFNIVLELGTLVRGSIELIGETDAQRLCQSPHSERPEFECQRHVADDSTVTGLGNFRTVTLLLRVQSEIPRLKSIERV